MILDTTTKSLQVLLAGAITTNQLPVYSTWVDMTASATIPGSTNLNSNSTTAVTAVAAPASATQRKVNFLSVYNADTVDATVIVQINDNGTTYQLSRVTLQPRYTLFWTDVEGWKVVSDTGNIQTGIIGPEGPDGPMGGGYEPNIFQLGWEATHFHNNTATTNQPFTGTAISSGTSVAGTIFNAKHPGTTRITSAAGANSGYRWQTAASLCGGAGLFVRAILYFETLTNTTHRIGFHDATTSADATDGAYFEILSATCSFKTANNATRTTHPTTATLSTATWYTFDVEYINDNEVQGTIRTDDGTVVYQQNITTNVVNVIARAFFAGTVSTYNTASSLAIAHLDYLGVGPAKPAGGGIPGTPGDPGDPGAIGPSGIANVTRRTVSGTSGALVIGDRGYEIYTTSATAVALTIPTNATVAFSTGDIVYIRQGAAGAITLTPAGGVTLHAPYGGTLVTPGLGSACALKYAGSDVWDVYGQTTEV